MGKIGYDFSRGHGTKEYGNRISVIVPVYNVELYLDRCMKSLLEQTWPLYEIILVINGCTDHSMELCRKYEMENPVVHCLESAKGVSRARNIGLTRVHGDWFAFVDADDWLDRRFFKTLLDNALATGATVSACQYEKTYSYPGKEPETDDSLFIIESPEKCIHSFICNDVDSLQGMVWNKIYKTSIYKDISFDPSLAVNEDCMYTFEIMKKCEIACTCLGHLYYWYQRDNSACHLARNKQDFSAANVFLTLSDKTANLNDKEINMTLKKNYLKCVVNMLLHVKKIAMSEECQLAVTRCKKLTKELWKELTLKDKVKYYIAKYALMRAYRTSTEKQ